MKTASPAAAWRLALLFLSVVSGASAAERINHEGRILGPMLVVTAPVLFNTAQADQILSAMQIMPRDSAWNEDVSRRPLLTNSTAMIARISSDLAASRRTLRLFEEMNFILVPDNQPRVDIRFLDYPDESDDLKAGSTDIGSYPLPTNLPVETWPSGTGALTLTQWQQDVNNDGGDRHAIVVMPGAGFIWELWQSKQVPTATPTWQASNGAKFPLSTNVPRSTGWTSGDAAGLPMFPALVRFDECERGMVEHAMRVVVKHSRAEYRYPANHFASSPSTTDPDVPAMGQRLRLKSGFVLPNNWTAQERSVALGLKKYGALVADNGGFFSISITPDQRWPAGCFDRIQTLAIDQFEVVQGTDAAAGPRSSGARTADAGPDQAVGVAAGAMLQGIATGVNATTHWSVYAASGSGSATVSTPDALGSRVDFTAPGTYTFMLRVDDGVHTPAFDAVILTVSASNPGDVDGDRQVTALDRTLVTNHLGQTSASPGWDARADADGNGAVTAADIDVVTRNFGRTYP